MNRPAVTRDAWRDAAGRAGASCVEVEVVCSDPVQHRRRVASRSVGIPDLPLPDRDQAVEREYEPWERERIVVDTPGESPEESPAGLLEAVMSVAADNFEVRGHHAPHWRGAHSHQPQGDRT